MENQQELIYKLSMYEQQGQQINQQLEVVSSRINDLEKLKEELSSLEGNKDNEILAQVAKGIFINAKMKDDKLLFDIGGGNFVKKSIPEGQKLLDEQIKKLEKIQTQLEETMEDLQKQMGDLISQAE